MRSNSLGRTAIRWPPGCTCPRGRGRIRRSPWPTGLPRPASTGWTGSPVYLPMPGSSCSFMTIAVSAGVAAYRGMTWILGLRSPIGDVLSRSLKHGPRWIRSGLESGEPAMRADMRSSSGRPMAVCAVLSRRCRRPAVLSRADGACLLRRSHSWRVPSVRMTEAASAGSCPRGSLWWPRRPGCPRHTTTPGQSPFTPSPPHNTPGPMSSPCVLPERRGCTSRRRGSLGSHRRRYS
ncbi:hypothetical protein SPURM210S_04333 [Streptomyces purpurascens]